MFSIKSLTSFILSETLSPTSAAESAPTEAANEAIAALFEATIVLNELIYAASPMSVINEVIPTSPSDPALIIVSIFD